MIRIATPKPGTWLRVTPDGKAVIVEVDFGPALGWFDFKADKGGWIEDDPEDTYYLPISEKLLRLASYMAMVLISFVPDSRTLAEYEAELKRLVGERGSE